MADNMYLVVSSYLLLLVAPAFTQPSDDIVNAIRNVVCAEEAGRVCVIEDCQLGTCQQGTCSPGLTDSSTLLNFNGVACSVSNASGVCQGGLCQVEIKTTFTATTTKTFFGNAAGLILVNVYSNIIRLLL